VGSNPTLSANLQIVFGRSMNRKERRAAGKRSPTGGGAQRPPDAAGLFVEAVRQHQLGRIFDAEALCRAVLSADASHAGALHLLGVIAMHRGLAAEAAGHFGKAAEIRPDIAIGHHSLGKALAAARRPDQAAPAFERTLALQPDFAEAHKDLGLMRMAQGRLKDASECFAKSLRLVPELAENFADTAATLLSVNPALREGVARAAAAWPGRLTIEQLLGAPGLAAIADDAMLLAVLKATTVRDVALERFLTSVRAATLESIGERAGDPDDAALAFCCALARQCFNNEYVFAEVDGETALAERQRGLLIEALDQNAAIPPLRVVAVASYGALSSLPNPQRLLDRAWPPAVDELLTQQVREPQAELRLRAATPRLTAIGGEGGGAVRQQYEENPYPRWVMAPSRPQPMTIDDYLSRRFPLAQVRRLGDRVLDVLVAGCGTGEHSIGTARRFKNVKLLAVDFSLASLGYAQRKTRELALDNIEYAQADILEIGTIGREFDVIDASGVLHHLADPMAGWRALLGTLRPGGLMRVGLYSERGRSAIVAARRFIAERGFAATAADIRRCRQELLGAPNQALVKYPDFFSTSGCRDLLFHVQEHRLDIPSIKEFLGTQNLKFLGFELDAEKLREYGARHPADAPMTDLDGWNAFERERPDTFAGMYQFWCQRG
jgi:SAM-dependent methyltransferase/tetratricopeptide (TPR) repeat protein